MYFRQYLKSSLIKYSQLKVHLLALLLKLVQTKLLNTLLSQVVRYGHLNVLSRRSRLAFVSVCDQKKKKKACLPHSLYMWLM